MIRFTVWKAGDQYRGFESSGHAGYDDAGRDIICSAVSVLTINTINSVDAFTADDFEVEQAEDGGFLRCMFPVAPSEKTALLMDSLILGIKSIQSEYGNDYITLLFEEV
jgi:uncharacterized protein YsxB (DUF464 family)